MSKSKVKVKMPSKMRMKLLSALSMLLVASTLMASTTYAWYALSTAPEVSGVATQVGANGSLEIALLTGETYDNLELLEFNEIDESVGVLYQGYGEQRYFNNIWGNVVDVNDPLYGIDKITLLPSRLNVVENGEKLAVGATLLKTPSYGEDGRIRALHSDKAITSTYQNGSFPASGDGYGVRAIGVPSSQSANQVELNSARNDLVNGKTGAKTQASKTLASTGSALGNIVVQYALAHKNDFGRSDIEAMKTLAIGLGEAYDKIELALRAVYSAYISSNKYTRPEGFDYNAAIEEINTASLDALRTKYPDPGVSNMSGDSGYVQKYLTNSAKVEGAITKCDQMLADTSRQTYTWAEISETMSPLVDYSKMTVGGKSISELQALAADMEANFAELVALVSGGIVIKVPSGSGIISDVADFAGDYVADITVENVMMNGRNMGNVNVTMTTETTESPVYLDVCSNAVRGFKASESGGASAGITDFYGYVLDLAVRTNARDSHLMLQTEPENRIYAGSDENQKVQGGGSYMQFKADSGVSVTKMVKMMRAMRVVFVDKSQNILAIAALDAQLGQDVYEILSDEEKAETKKFAKLSMEKTGVPAQVSDYIDQVTYNELPVKSAVDFEPATGKIMAKLYLYNYERTISTYVPGEGEPPIPAGEVRYTGGMTILDKRSSGQIVALEEDKPFIISAIVYLDGSYVNNSMVAADAANSMSGKLNLQFSSDVDLIPAEISELRNGKPETTPTESEPPAGT